MADRMAGVDGPFVEGARNVESAAGRIKERVVDGTKEQLEHAREYVTEHPMKTVLLAVGVGALVGYLLGRRSA